MYALMLGKQKEIYILQCLPDCEKDFLHVDLNNLQEITIGKKAGNSITYKNPMVSDVHARIYKFNGKWTIENFDLKYGVFVNNFPVYDNVKNIFNGDIIFIMGLEIIMIKNSLYVNNAFNSVNLNDKNFTLSNVKNVELKSKTENIDVYADEEEFNYYSRAPRVIPPIKKEQVTIDQPPDIQEDLKKPKILVLGSSLAMGVLMLTSLTSTIQGITKGTATGLEIAGGLITTIVMLIAMIIIPIMDIKWDEKSKKKYEEKRQKKYRQYLAKKEELINEIKDKQRNILYENYLSDTECAKIITQNSPRLWERKISDDDFLFVRLGIGNVLLNIDITYPQEKFALEDDNLLDVLNKIITNSKFIENAPITMSLVQNNICSIISKDEDFTLKYIKNLIMQLITFHSYEDLKLVFLLDEEKSKDWQFVKMLPHIWDNSKQIRFFADTYDDMCEISRYLQDELKDRKSKEKNNKIMSPYYLIITDDYKRAKNTTFIREFLKEKENLGFSLLCITDYVFNAPSVTKTFIEIQEKSKGVLYENGIDEANQTEINIEVLGTMFFEKFARKLANIPVKLNAKDTTKLLPKSYTFLEMFNVGNIQQLNTLERWKKNDSILSLKAPVGIDSNGMIINLDAHEKFHGPHGLIAGSTGSGKSEFIITYILSLAINYSPDDVTFLLIDYKGGGLAGAFQKNNIKLPHLVGTITNIDKYGLQRSLTSIQSELRRRQVIFNQARDMTDEGTIDIYKYQKLYHDGIVNEAISHLFIICDEFAELKQQQPEFMDELMSVSRIGRSLGVHLILATQKPSGIVNEQIRSNSKFAVCLKVQDTSDSIDVISKPDAAYLKNPGQFYFRVGQDEYFALGQSGWAGAQYIPSNVPKKRLDNSIEFISNTGLVIKKIDDAKQNFNNEKAEQLTSILKYIYLLAEKNNLKSKNLWLEDIPQDIYVNEIRKKYFERKNKNIVEVVIGEYDDPSNQRQGLVKIDLTKRENVIIYGNAESGKETLLSTLIYDVITNYTSTEVQLYVLDFGTEALKIYKKAPHVGDVIFMGDDGKLETFFEMIQAMIKQRKEILSNYNGDYNLYIEEGNVMPIITIIINNYEGFDEAYENKYDDLILTLTREGAKCGMVFVVTASSTSAMRYRLTQNFSKKIGLQLNDENDYYSMFDNVKNKRPTRVFGRGLVSIENDLFEFQTAKICKHVEYNEFLEETFKRLNKENKVKAMPVPTLPNKIELEDFEQYLSDITKVPIGLVKKNLNVYMYNFLSHFVTVISAKQLKDCVQFITYVFEELKQLPNVEVKILDAEKSKNNLKKAYNDFQKEIKNDIKNNTEKFILYTIIGIDNFTSEDIIDEFKFSELLEKVKNTGRQSFVILENPDKLEGHTYDEWYTNYINADTGIWIGNGIENQTLITTNFSISGLENNCGNSYGYVVEEGIPTLIKFLGIAEGM